MNHITLRFGRIAMVGAASLVLLLSVHGCAKKKGSKSDEAAPKASAGMQQAAADQARPQTEKVKASVGEQILVYLGYKGYKSASSPIATLCGQYMKGQGGLPSGVSLDQGTGFASSFGPDEQIRVLGKTGEKAMLMCKEGATVEYGDGSVLVMKNGHWIDKATGEDRGFGELEEIPLKW